MISEWIEMFSRFPQIFCLNKDLSAAFHNFSAQRQTGPGCKGEDKINWFNQLLNLNYIFIPRQTGTGGMDKDKINYCNQLLILI